MKKDKNDSKTSDKFYFSSESDNVCYNLDELLLEAKEDGLKEIELEEAVIDKGQLDCYWCQNFCNTVEKLECSKKYCSGYQKPEKGNTCDFRGKLYYPGKKVKFNVETGKEIK